VKIVFEKPHFVSPIYIEGIIFDFAVFYISYFGRYAKASLHVVSTFYATPTLIKGT
jgi:hypothetical protein